jgi:hypothetical protein
MKELEARVTLQAAEIARLFEREGTVCGQIEDLQERLNAVAENIQELITAPGPLHARVKALEEQIHGMKITDSALEKGIDAIAERSAKYECPCFFAINGASSCKERNQGRGDAKTCPSFPGSCFDCGYVGCIHCGKTVTVPADERERVAAYCESRGFVDTVRVIRAMGDKVKP